MFYCKYKNESNNLNNNTYNKNIMKSSFASYSKSRKMGKKFSLRIKENNEAILKAKESDKVK